MAIHDPRLAARLAPLARYVEAVVPEAALLARLESGQPLRCKYGIDPTATSVHVGHGIPLWNLRRLQDLGHKAVLILGDATAQVGDPSGKDRTRPVLTPEQIEVNLAGWLDQIGRILILEDAEIHRNSTWFSNLSFGECLELMGRMTVQQLMERDSFQERWRSGSSISMREFFYCLMQGWDSVQVRADVELGGTDQTFNLMVGRRLMEQVGLEAQCCLVNPLLCGIDGQEKMSKSLGNSIGVTDEPKEQFGRVMRLPDAALPGWLRVATDLPEERIQALLNAGDPMAAKLELGAAIVSRYHGAGAGELEREEFLRVFSRREAPSELGETPLPEAGDDGRWWIVDLLKTAGFAASTGEARRMIEGGGAFVDDIVVDDWRARLSLVGGEVLRAGRRRQTRLVRHVKESS